ncbi:MAG: hypothetical protein ACJ0GH_03185 [Alphaproteobacteria bacterium]
MLTLSIFCSSQTISLAIYSDKKLENFSEKKIINGKVDGVFGLIQYFSNKHDFKNLKYIFISLGPGSFTALRSIKSISQALAFFSNAKVISTSTFTPYLVKNLNIGKNVIVSFRSTKMKFFYQQFSIIENKILKKSHVFHESAESFHDFFLAKEQRIDNLLLITDELKFSKKIDKRRIKVESINAKDLANSIFSGFGTKKLDIFYHNTYYE